MRLGWGCLELGAGAEAPAVTQLTQAGPAAKVPLGPQTPFSHAKHKTEQTSSCSQLLESLSFSIVTEPTVSGVQGQEGGRMGQRLRPELLTPSLGWVTPKSSWAAPWEKVKLNIFHITGLTWSLAGAFQEDVWPLFIPALLFEGAPGGTGPPPTPVPRALPKWPSLLCCKQQKIKVQGNF